MNRLYFHRSSSSSLPHTETSCRFLCFLVGLVLGRWICRRLYTRSRDSLADRSFRAHESWQWMPAVDEEEEDP
jgi:hypothetical protein